MKNKTRPSLRRHQVLRTDVLQEGQDFTARVWAKHKSHVIGDGGYESTISRVPLGRSFLCLVDCPSPMHVEAEGNNTKATFYLPQAGSMAISARGKQLSAVPGGPVLIPAKTKIQFQATAIHCVLLEVSAAKLQAQLAAHGIAKTRIPPLAWAPDAPDARSLTQLLAFALIELDRDDDGLSPGTHLLRLESLILSALARAIASRLASPASPGKKSGQETLENIRTWIAKNLRRDFHSAELAAAAGVSPRTLQQIFLKYANTTPAHYVSGLRMETARADLLDPKNTKTVSEIAAALNFLHFGRFACAYQRKFGETPSATLKRCGRYPKSEHK